MNYKSHIRSEVLARRDAMPQDLRAQKSDEIARKLFDIIEHEMPTSFQPQIAVFEPMSTEVDLQPFIHQARLRTWGLCFPCVVRNDLNKDNVVKYMAFFRVSPEQYKRAQDAFLSHPMRIHSLATLTQEGFAEVAPDALDVVVVPLVAFDNNRNRLGYGGGNYDRLLPRLRSDALVLGVAFDEQRVPTVPCEPHDQQLPRVVSA